MTKKKIIKKLKQKNIITFRKFLTLVSVDIIFFVKTYILLICSFYKINFDICLKKKFGLKLCFYQTKFFFIKNANINQYVLNLLKLILLKKKFITNIFSVKIIT